MTLPPMPIVLVLEGSNRIRAWFAASETGYSGSTVAVSRSRKAKWLFHQEKDTLKWGRKRLQVLWNRSSPPNSANSRLRFNASILRPHAADEAVGCEYLASACLRWRASHRTSADQP